MKTFEFKVWEEISDMRMSDYLKSKLGLSTSLITAVKFGGVRLNGEVVTMRARVSGGDVVSITFPDEKSENIEPIEMPLDILYEDEHTLAVNKPRGMATHPARGTPLPTLANGVSRYLGCDFVFRAINRLDTGTAGIVLIAKNPLAAAVLGRAMKERKIKKYYTALVDGIPTEREGEISAPIAREQEGNIKRVVRNDGKAALTKYRVTKTIEGNAVCEIELLTGRTHQIRVHFAHIGHALVGDFLYGTPNDDGYRLTCHKLVFPHPITKDEITVEAPTDF